MVRKIMSREGLFVPHFVHILKNLSKMNCGSLIQEITLSQWYKNNPINEFNFFEEKSKQTQPTLS